MDLHATADPDKRLCPDSSTEIVVDSLPSLDLAHIGSPLDSA
jgi:hypothetical protein